MTSDTIELIRRDAKTMQPPAIGRLIATMFTAIFVAIGWVIGALWYATMFAFVAARYGFRQGAHIERRQQEASG